MFRLMSNPLRLNSNDSGGPSPKLGRNMSSHASDFVSSSINHKKRKIESPNSVMNVFGHPKQHFRTRISPQSSQCTSETWLNLTKKYSALLICLRLLF